MVWSLALRHDTKQYPVVWSLALRHDTKQDPVVYGAEFGVVFLAEGLRTTNCTSMQEGLDCLVSKNEV